MRIPLIAGRDFAVTDTAVTDTVSRPEVGIVNQTFAKKFFGDENPIGKRLNAGNQKQPEWIEIIGVVGDVKDQAVDVDIVPMLYVNFAQSPSRFMALTLRTKGEPYALLGDVRQGIWSVDKDQPLDRILSMNDAAGEALAVRKITTSIMTMFGTISMVLACIGIYGVIAFSVVQRTHEFGIRMALGAEPHRVLSMVLADATKLGAVGICLGLIASLLLSRFADSIVYGISTRDPLTFLGTSVLLGVVAVGAALIPALRASRLDPNVALRQE
jgi:putative ABC transport system permease protein